MKKGTFQDFKEFWFYTKELSGTQRNILFSSLPTKEQKKIQRSYNDGKWEDLFMRNRIDNILDGIKKDYQIDLLAIKGRVLKGKCFYMKRDDWKQIHEILSNYHDRHIMYVVGGIDIEDVDSHTVCLVPKKK